MDWAADEKSSELDPCSDSDKFGYLNVIFLAFLATQQKGIGTGQQFWGIFLDVFIHWNFVQMTFFFWSSTYKVDQGRLEGSWRKIRILELFPLGFFSPSHSTPPAKALKSLQGEQFGNSEWVGV